MRVPDKSSVEALAIRTFGEVTIELRSTFLAGLSATSPNFARVRFATRTVDALLVYLACHKQALGRDALAELFWPERTQKQARSNLRVALHRLRQQLAPHLLVTYHTVALNPDSAIDLDVAQFEAHLAAGQLEAAVDLYTGDFLDGFYLDGSPAFEQWALLERERLRTLALAAYQQLSVQRAATGEWSLAIASARRLLQLDPLHEPTHRQLMRLLAQSGQRSAALAQFETCRQLLSADLNVLPDETTTALVEQIQTGDLGSAIYERQEHGAGKLNSVHRKSEIVERPNVPSQPTPFIGRDAELVQVENLLSNPDCRLLTLLGVGGIGKTRLAVEIARRQASNFADAVCFVPLAPVTTAELGMVEIAHSLGLQSTSSDVEKEIAAYLQPRQLLLILDNFEHLLEAADVVARLLQNAPLLKVLVTSRERLYLREEWLLPITGLSLAQGLAGEAGQLFLRSVQRVKPDFTDYGEEAAIADVCRQVEGMPLALELAASWVRVMPCADIARQIQANLDFLSTEVRNLPERHRSIRSLFDGSWRLLSPVEQGVLRRVSIFRGGWTLDEAAEVAGATPALLIALVDKSLVRASGHNRFDLHELVRQYAMEQLVANGEASQLRQRHYAAYLQLFRTADSHLRRPGAAIWLARLEAEQDNVRAALQWALDEARYEDVAWLLIAINWLWFLRGNWFEFGGWLAQLLPHRRALASDLHLAILVFLYIYARSLEEFHPLDRFTDEIMELLEVCQDKLMQACVWHFIATYSSDFSEAAAAWERGIALARAAGEEPGLGVEFCLFTDHVFILASELFAYAGRLVEHGEFTRAETLASESLALVRTGTNFYDIGYSLGVLGRLAQLQGDLAQAHSLLREAVTLAAAYGHQEVLGTWQPLLGLVTLYNGDAAEARRLLNDSLRLCINLKDNTLLARNCAYLAEVALWEGELDQAKEWLAQSLAYYADPQRTTIHQIARLFVAARLATAQQQYPRAATLFGLADQAHSRIHYKIAGPIRSLADQALAIVREALGAELFDEAFAAGQKLSLDEAFNTLLAPAHIRSLATGPA